MKQALLINVAQSPASQRKWAGVQADLQAALGTSNSLSVSSMVDLQLVVNSGQASITDNKQGFDISEFDLVVIYMVGAYTEVAIAIAAYCRHHNIIYTDQYFPAIGNAKLSCAFSRWEQGMPIPDTMFGSPKALLAWAREGHFGWPLVAKDDAGTKGRTNFLIDDAEALRTTFDDNPAIKFVLQRYIPNEGDYRLLVCNGKLKLAIYRQAATSQYLNNVSQGAAAQLVDLASVPDNIRALAERAAQHDKLAVAGVDIIVNKQTQVPYILEVNREPQVFSGAFISQKKAVYAATIKELLGDTHKNN